ncbi:MAG TPA: hypothetical protein VK774_05645 [Solirubrobacteraceae bacterium]|nr:hypothetical protein [Solirubrobacteraceae bacterium]
MPRLLTPLVCALLCALPAAAEAAADSPGSASQPAQLVSSLTASIATTAPASSDADAASSSSTRAGSSTTETNPEAPVPVPPSNVPPAGRHLSANQVLAIAARLPKMKQVRAKYAPPYEPRYFALTCFIKNGKKEIGQVIIDDLSGRVLEQWTGFQVAWTMARGYKGAFGRHVNALYIWLPLCVLFLLPFVDFRRPLRWLHLDLLVLLSFSVSLAFFNHGRIYQSVPLAYPPLLYLFLRMLALTRRRRRGRGDGAGPSVQPDRTVGPLHLLVPAPWLALGVVFLIGFRIALNVTDSNVIDVGYAGVIGAQRIVHDEPLYGHFPIDNEHGDTYGPVNYESYVPFEQLFGWSGKWDDLPAAHAAAIVFDLLALALMFLIGRRVRGPSLGVALAYGWAAYPFTLFALESNSNDTLVAVFVLAAILAATYSSKLAPGARGAFAALAGLTKFAPLALAPLLATHGLWQRTVHTADGTEIVLRTRTRLRELLSFLIAFAAIGAIASIPALSHDSLHTIYERTFAYQANRGSPFSVWGLYGGLGGWQEAVQIGAVLFAVALAVIPRRADVVGLAAACGAVIIAAQLGIDHWFYLYIPWFFPLVLIALLGRFGPPGPRKTLRPASGLLAEPASTSEFNPVTVPAATAGTGPAIQAG